MSVGHRYNIPPALPAMTRSQNSIAEVSDYEKQRLANIAERDALLKKLTQEAHQAGLYTKPPRKGTTNDASQSTKRKRPVKPVKKEEDNLPRRTSSRLAGLTADSEVARRKLEQEYESVREAGWAKRQRIAGDQELGDILVNGKGLDVKGRPLLGFDVINRGIAKPYERTFGDDEITETTDKELKAIREKMSGLELWDAWEPNRLKITPERIYSMSFHPTKSKPLIFAGDKLGNLGIIDASQRGPQVKDEDEGDDEDAEGKEKNKVKKESVSDSNPGDKEASDSDEEDSDPHITILKPHQRTISAMHTHPAEPQTLYTASYDSSIRGLDLEKSKSTDLFALDDEPISGIDMAVTDPHVLYFTTLNGGFGTHDIRTKHEKRTNLCQLSDKKIGGFSLHPLAPHYLATASLDRTMRLWDLRKMTKMPTLVGKHESGLSVSHAAFNSVGQVATSSYDNTIKIHSFGVRGKIEGAKNSTNKLEALSTWNAKYQLDEERMTPEVVIRHNCQTGRWVTM